MSDNIFIATKYQLNPNQLLGMQINNKAIVVQIVREVTKEEHHSANPEHTEKDYAELPQDVHFYETSHFTGEVVLAMQQVKKPNDIVRNQQLGTWRILRSATPQEYLDSLVKHGETGPNSAVLDPIMTLIRAGQGEVNLYWATPYLVPTIAMHLTKDELLFLAQLLHDWTHDQEAPGDGERTFVIAKLKEALGQLFGEDSVQKLQDQMQEMTQENLAQVPVSVDRVH